MVTRGLGPRPRRTAVAALAALAVAATGLATTGAAPATAAPAPCATPYPVTSLTTGQAVTGLTVSQGTTPGEFQGTITGVLDDGIAPGVDMVLAELTSTAVDRYGVWAGMSGSPVYADAGRTQLIGAVSYTLTEGKSTLAGITPAADMLALPSGAAASSARLTPGLRSQLAASGTATRAQLASGLRQLPTPIAVSGLSERRFKQLAGWLDDHGPVRNAGGVGTSAAVADASDIVPGGNIAASLGWGFVSAAGTGTVTEVCGDEVVAFGHPLDYLGDTTYSLHPASAVAIANGEGADSFKVANLGERVGSITTDRLAGIRGRLGAAPTAYDVTATAIDGGRSVTGTTHVTVADMVADAGLANTFAVNDRALDRSGKGSAVASWTITGKRRSGAAFKLSHRDVYSSTYDISSAPAAGLAMQLEALLGNEAEAVSITGITTSTRFSSDAPQWRIGRTYWRHRGAWKRVTAEKPAVITAGKTRAIRVELYARDRDSRFVDVPVRAGRASVGRTGLLRLEGGWGGGDEDEWYESSEEFYDEYGEEIAGGGSKPRGIAATLKSLAAQPKNDTVGSTFRVRGTPGKKRKVSLGQVVSGGAVVPVVVRR